MAEGMIEQGAIVVEPGRKRRRPRPEAPQPKAETLQEDIDALQDKLLMDKLEPEEEERMTKLIALRRALNQGVTTVGEGQKEERVKAIEAAAARTEKRETRKSAPRDLGTADQERVMGLLTKEEQEAVRVERALAPHRKVLSAAQEEEAWVATRIENTHGKHPAALEIQRAGAGSKLGRWFKRGLHSLMGEPSPDEMLVRDLAEWRAAAERVERLREQVGEQDQTGVGAARVEDRKLRANLMRKHIDEEQAVEAIGDREAAAEYRAKYDLTAPGGDLQNQERGFFDDSRSLEEVADADSFREKNKGEIELAGQLFTEYASNVLGKTKTPVDHRGYAGALWDEVQTKLNRRSAATLEKAARIMGTHDIATAYMLDLAKLAKAAIEESQDTRERITDLDKSLELSKTLTEAEERVREINRLLGWDEERNIRPREQLATPRRQIRRAA